MLAQIESYVLATAVIAVIVLFGLSVRKPGATELGRLAILSSLWGLMLCGKLAEKTGKMSGREIGSHIYIMGGGLVFLGLAYAGWKTSRKKREISRAT